MTGKLDLIFPHKAGFNCTDVGINLCSFTLCQNLDTISRLVFQLSADACGLLSDAAWHFQNPAGTAPTSARLNSQLAGAHSAARPLAGLLFILAGLTLSQKLASIMAAIAERGLPAGRISVCLHCYC